MLSFVWPPETLNFILIRGKITSVFGRLPKVDAWQQPIEELFHFVKRRHRRRQRRRQRRR